jgi:hypothetical protein
LDAPDALTKCEGTRSAGIPASQISVRPGTKLAAIVDATIAQMMAGNGWQAHTVRGAISGMVRKRLGYVVVTEKGADGRAYRIA